jgi:hypothetical protein
MANDCPDAAYGYHSLATREGRCIWCGQLLKGPMPKPLRWTRFRSDLEDAYRRAWDPDWGSGAYDSDPA